MPTTAEIKALIDQMPELDNPPPDPPPPPPAVEPKPKDPSAKTPDGKDPKPPEPKPAVAPKPPPKPPGAPLKGKLTGPAWDDAAKIYDAILAGGKDSVAALIDLLVENDIGPAYKTRYVLHGLATYTARPGKEKERAALVAALIAKLPENKPKTITALLIRTLQASADQAAIASLAPYLSDEELADPAAQAIVTLATLSADPKPADAAPVLRAALEKSTARPKLALIQAMAGVRDAGAVALLTPLAADQDENIRITALWSLAKSGSPAAAAPILKAADAPEGWPRSQAVKAAFQLAETLAANNQKDDAIKIYQYLIQSRSADHERYIKQAAQRGLDALKP